MGMDAGIGIVRKIDSKDVESYVNAWNSLIEIDEEIPEKVINFLKENGFEEEVNEEEPIYVSEDMPLVFARWVESEISDEEEKAVRSMDFGYDPNCDLIRVSDLPKDAEFIALYWS